MGQRVQQIMREEGAIAVRDEWQEQVKVVVPELAEAQARRLGLDRPDVARTIQANFDGTQTGVLREGDELLPILARAPEAERGTVDSLRELQIWSPLAGRMVPMRQLLLGFITEYEEGTIFRWNRRKRSATVSFSTGTMLPVNSKTASSPKPEKPFT